MIDFQEQLRHALSRKEPSAGFAERVLVRAHTRRSRWKSWMAGRIAASLIAGVVGLVDLEQRRERQRAEAAHVQLIKALRITSSKLQRIEKKLEGHRL